MNEAGEKKECAKVIYGNLGTESEKLYCAECRKIVHRANVKCPHCGLALLWKTENSGDKD